MAKPQFQQKLRAALDKFKHRKAEQLSEEIHCAISKGYVLYPEEEMMLSELDGMLTDE